MNKDMKDIFEGQPLSAEAPQGLRNKVEYASRQEPRKSWFAPRYRWAAAGGAVAAAVVGVAMFMAPSSAEAKTWDMVTQAYQKVKGVLIQMTFSEPDGESGELTIAGKGGDWRVSVKGLEGGVGETMDISYSRGELTLWDGGDTAQVINLGINIPFEPEQLMQGLAEQLTASKIFEEHADEIGRKNIRVEQPVVVSGRRVYNVYITDPDNSLNRVHVLVDADTDLPISMRIDGERGELMQMSFRFDGDFDRSYLQPVLPTGIKFEHLDMKSMGGEGEEMFRGLEEIGKAFEKGHDGGGVLQFGHEERKQVLIQPVAKVG